jgi:hypothetical protein
MSRRVHNLRTFAHSRVLALFLWLVLPFSPTDSDAIASGVTFPMSYSGRLTSATDAPLLGPCDLTIKVCDAQVDGTQRGRTFTFTDVVLEQGVATR